MSPVTLFEHEYTAGFDWTDRDAALLERLRRAFGVEILRPTIRNGRRELQAAQHVGVVRLGGRTVQILPKIHARSAGDPEREATGNLLHLLAYAGQLPVREHALAALRHRSDDWFEILTRLFAAHLGEEWRRGVVRRYETREDVLPMLRGKWRIGDQLRRPHEKHRFAVAPDEFTADNALNRVFRFVVERLWQQTRDADNRRLLGELRHWMEDEAVALLPGITAADAAPALLTRLHRRYAPLLTLARLFLENGALDVRAGETDTFAFVLDMNRLFEGFVAGFLLRHRDEILPGPLKGCDLLPQTRGAERHLARVNGRPTFRLKPDLAFRDADNTFPLLLDAKYKRLAAGDARLGVSPEDFYQMFAYAHRYECSRVLLLYPQTAEMPAPLRQRFAVSGTNKTITAATINLAGNLGTAAGRTALAREIGALIEEVREETQRGE